MIRAQLSQSSLGQQLSEVALATALALPLIFAFSEMRGSWLVRGELPPQLVNLLRSVNPDAASGRVSTMAGMTSASPAVREVATSRRRAIAGTREARIEANVTTNKGPVRSPRVGNGLNRNTSALATKAESSSPGGRRARLLGPRGTENSSQTQH